MMETWLTTETWGWVSTVVAGLASCWGAWTTFLLQRSKEQHRQRMELLPSHEARINALETAHARCMEEHAQAERELGTLQQVVANLKEQEDFKAQLNRMEMYVHSRVHDILNALSLVTNKIVESSLLMSKITQVSLVAATQAASAPVPAPAPLQAAAKPPDKAGG
jgi:hypothetical protein